MRPFHYAFKVKDIESTRSFYVGLLGCTEGRSAKTWIDFDFYGNQLSAHLSDSIPPADYCGEVDGVKVPIPHFGCILSREDFEAVQRSLEDNGAEFIIRPCIRYPGSPGEQLTMFVCDPSGNALEFKAFRNEEELFSRGE